MLRATILYISMIGSAVAAEINDIVKDNTGFVIIRGEFQDGDGVKFNRVAQKYSKAVVLFESPGGELLTGMAIGEAIRLKGFVTIVTPNSICASSCALAWLGGSQRLVSASARLGFHAAYRMDGTTARETGLGNAVVGAYLTRIGLPLDAGEIHGAHYFWFFSAIYGIASLLFRQLVSRSCIDCSTK